MSLIPSRRQSKTSTGVICVPSKVELSMVYGLASTKIRGLYYSQICPMWCKSTAYVLSLLVLCVSRAVYLLVAAFSRMICLLTDRIQLRPSERSLSPDVWTFGVPKGDYPGRITECAQVGLAEQHVDCRPIIHHYCGLQIFNPSLSLLGVSSRSERTGRTIRNTA